MSAAAGTRIRFKKHRNLQRGKTSMCIFYWNIFLIVDVVTIFFPNKEDYISRKAL